MVYNVNAKEFIPISLIQENKMFNELEKQWWNSNKSLFEDTFIDLKLLVLSVIRLKKTKAIDWCDDSPMDFSQIPVFV